MSATVVVRPDRGYWILWCTAAGVLLVAGLAASATGTVGGMPRVWLFSTVGFSWITLSWTTGRLPSPTPRLYASLAALAVLAGGTAVLMEASVTDVLRSAVGVPLQSFVMAWVYLTARRLARSPRHHHLDGVGAWRNAWVRSWAPTTALDLAFLGVAALAGGMVGLLVGAAPGLFLGNVTTGVALQWMTHVFVVASVGGATTLTTFGTWSSAELDQPWLEVLLIWLASVGMLWWVYSTGAVNMAWLAVLPAIHVALNHRPWVTHTFGLLVGLVSILLSPALNVASPGTGPVPLGSVMDLLVSTLILVALLLAQLNQRRMQLVADLQTERALARRQADILQNVFETLQDGVVVLDRHLSVRMHNSAAVTLLGRGFPPTRPPSWTAWFRMTRLDGSPLLESELIASDYLTMRVGDGSRVLRQTVSRVAEHREAGWTVFVTDVTEHHARLKELSGFAGVVAHDLRAPLTSLEGWLEMAEESLSARDPEEASALLTRARASNRRMREVITDWLAYTVEREGTLDTRTFALTTVVRSAVTRITERGPHQVVVDTPHDVQADVGLVRQLLDNLLGNASKFARPRQLPVIEVRSSVERGWVRVDVVDHGIGLPPGEEERIFEDYHRASGTASSKEGFGMGLAACRRIVERHGGEISAHSNEHGGATVSFTLPAGRTPVVAPAWSQA